MGAYSVETDMHREVEWLQPADEYILDFLTHCRCRDDNPAKQTPKTIGLNTPYGRKHAGNRCRVLAEHGLVEQLDRGVYRATPVGEEFATGGLSVEDVREL